MYATKSYMCGIKLVRILKTFYDYVFFTYLNDAMVKKELKHYKELLALYLKIYFLKGAY